MAFCTYAEGSAVLGATSVGNLFLMEYMPQAPGDYVKVYLYALLLCRFPLLGDSLEQTADALHMEPEAVLAAFRYWKREGLVEQLSDNPPSFALLPLTLAGAQAQDDGEIYENRSYNRQLQELMPGLVLEAHELRMAADSLDVYKMEPDAVLLIVKTEVERRGGKLPTARTMFRALEKSVRELAENGNTTLSAVERTMALEGASGEVAKQNAPQTVRIEIIVLTKDFKNDMSGYKDVVIILDRIRDYLVSGKGIHGVASMQYPLTMQMIEDDFPKPFFEGSLTTYWAVYTKPYEDIEQIL